MHLEARFEDIVDLAALERRWRALEEEAAPASFFLRWTWMGCWLAALENAQISLPRLLCIADANGRDVALVLIGRGHAARKLGKVPALWFNESGHDFGDRPYIEYNGLLCGEAHKPAAIHSLYDAVADQQEWRVFHISGVEFGSRLPHVPNIRRTILRDASPAYFVNLEKVRNAEGDYLSLLSSNTRSQIRRSLKEEPDELEIARADDAVTLDLWLEDMARLNTGRHEDNAWDNAFFRDFAQRIAHAGLADGTVELLRIGGAGELPLGYLLNFLWAGRAMNYQSAFAQPRSNKSKPGLMCHVAAVGRYADAGLSLYSLLAGKDRYKQSLSTGAEELNWWALERFDWRLESEALLRRLLKR